MTKEIVARAVARWWASVLSSGERSIESHLGAAKIDHKAGQGIRLVDIPVSGKFGLFNDLHEGKDGSVFSDEIRKRLIHTKVSVGSTLAEFLPKFGSDLSAQELRVARAFTIFRHQLVA